MLLKGQFETFLFICTTENGPCHCCGLLCTNSSSGAEENYFHITNQAFQLCCEDLLEKIDSVMWFLEYSSQHPFFFSPSPSPGTSSASFSRLNRVSNSYPYQLLSFVDVSVLQLLLRALRPN